VPVFCYIYLVYYARAGHTIAQAGVTQV
jgi:hypothetical protein